MYFQSLYARQWANNEHLGVHGFFFTGDYELQSSERVSVLSKVTHPV